MNPSNTSVYKGLLEFACQKKILSSFCDKSEHIGKVNQFRGLSVFHMNRKATHLRWDRAYLINLIEDS